MKLTTKISATRLDSGRHAARYLGAEAFANDEGFNSCRDDIAVRYGYENWVELPKDLRSDAMRLYTEGRMVEKRAAGARR